MKVPIRGRIERQVGPYSILHYNSLLGRRVSIGRQLHPADAERTLLATLYEDEWIAMRRERRSVLAAAQALEEQFTEQGGIVGGIVGGNSD